MRISIVTISFNQAEFLERAILSVIDQDYDNIEYIVVDAGSTDGSRDIIERYRNRITKLILEPDEGPADGLNKGFAAASGDIFGYINADDEFLPGSFRKVAKYFCENHETDVVTAHGYIVDLHGKPKRRFRSVRFDARRFVYGSAVMMQQSTFFQRRSFLSVGGFNANNSTTWDGELVLDMALNGCKFKLIDDYWSLFRIHNDSITGSKNNGDECRKDKERFFKNVMGRPKRPYDKLIFVFARIEKWLNYPLVPLIRIYDKLIGCPEYPGYNNKKP